MKIAKQTKKKISVPDAPLWVRRKATERVTHEIIASIDWDGNSENRRDRALAKSTRATDKTTTGE